MAPTETITEHDSTDTACGELLVLDALQSGDDAAEWSAQRVRFGAGLTQGDPDTANSALTRMVELAEKLKRHDLLAETYADAALVAGAEGRFDDVAELHHRVASTGHALPAGTGAWQRIQAARETGGIDADDITLVFDSSPPSIRAMVHCWAAAVADPGHAEPKRRLHAAVCDVDPGLITTDEGLPAALCMAAEVAALAEHLPLADHLYVRLRPLSDACVTDRPAARVWFGSTHLYLGALASVTGDLAAADEHLERARHVHTRMGARCLVVRGRWWQARVARLGGDHRTADRELTSVERSARALGMAPTAKRCATRRTQSSERGGTDRTRARWHLRQDGDTWLISTMNAQVRVHDRKGLGYIHRLLSEPRRELHVLDLSSSHGIPFDPGAGPMLDGEAKAAYRRRIEDLRDQIDEGERWHDPERVARAEAELEALAREVAVAAGLGGRDRPSDAGERARVAVRKAIRAAIDRISEVAPEVGAHLEASIRTGYYCVYQPDPATPVTWAA